MISNAVCNLLVWDQGQEIAKEICSLKTVEVTNLIGRPMDDNLTHRNYSNNERNIHHSLKDSRFATFEIGIQVNPTQIGL